MSPTTSGVELAGVDDGPPPRRSCAEPGSRPRRRLRRGARDHDGRRARPARRPCLARLGRRARHRRPGRARSAIARCSSLTTTTASTPRGARAARRARARRRARRGAARGSTRSRCRSPRPRPTSPRSPRSPPVRAPTPCAPTPGQRPARRGRGTRGGAVSCESTSRRAPTTSCARGADLAARAAVAAREVALAATGERAARPRVEPGAGRGAGGRRAELVPERRSPASGRSAARRGGVDVCVVDSGVEAATHSSAASRARRPSCARASEIAVVEDEQGDVCGHGTACAGIIRSLAPDCRLHSVRVLGAGATGRRRPDPRAACATRSRRAIDVISLSLSTTKQRFAEELHELADTAYFNRTVHRVPRRTTCRSRATRGGSPP